MIVGIYLNDVALLQEGAAGHVGLHVLSQVGQVLLGVPQLEVATMIMTMTSGYRRPSG